MSAGVRTLRVVGLRAAVGPLSSTVITARGAPGTGITVPTDTALVLLGGTPIGSMSGHRWVRAYSYAPRLAGPARAGMTIVPLGVLSASTTVPAATLLVSGFPVTLSSVGFRLPRVRVLTLAPMLVGQARAARTLFPAPGSIIYRPPAGGIGLVGFAPIATTASVVITTPTGSVLLTGQVADDGVGIAGVVVAMLQPDLRYRAPPRAYYIRSPGQALRTEVQPPSGSLGLAPGTLLLDTTGNLTLNILPGQIPLTAGVPAVTSVIVIPVPTVSLGLTGLFVTPTATANLLIVPGRVFFPDPITGLPGPFVDIASVLALLGFPPVLPPGPVSIAAPGASMLLQAIAPRILTARLKFHTPLGASVFPHATMVVVAPHLNTVIIL